MVILCDRDDGTNKSSSYPIKAHRVHRTSLNNKLVTSVMRHATYLMCTHTTIIKHILACAVVELKISIVTATLTLSRKNQ